MSTTQTIGKILTKGFVKQRGNREIYFNTLKSIAVPPANDGSRPYVRVTASEALGLRNIAKLVGGQIAVQSVEGKDNMKDVFVFNLPASLPPVAPRKTRTAKVGA